MDDRQLLAIMSAVILASRCQGADQAVKDAKAILEHIDAVAYLEADNLAFPR